MALGTPLLAALVLAHRALANRARGLDLAAWAALPACLAAVWLPDGDIELDWLLLGSRLGLDPTGRVFLAFTALLWLAAGIFARGYLRDDPRARRFFGFFLLSMAGNLGLVLAQDAVVFFAFFTLMSLAAYGLVVHDPTPGNLRAGRVYIVLAVAGEVLLFTALVLLGGAGDGLRFPLTGNPAASAPLVLALVLLGFGIKAGALPLHVWLPLAHPAAPSPASAVLSGAMIKAGLLGWLRFLPLGEVPLPDLGALLVAAGLLAAYYGVAIGLAQRDPKTVLAYSSIAQMGIMTVALGVGLAAPEAWPALLTATLVYAVHHGLAKGALFLGTGIAARSSRRRPVLWGLGFAALALAGAPLTSGALAKSMLNEALVATPGPPGLLGALLTLAAVGTALLMARLLFVVAQDTAHHPEKVDAWARGAWLASLAAVAGGALLVPGASGVSLEIGALAAAAWPPIAGILVALAAWRLLPPRSRLPRWTRVPAGDLVVPGVAVVARARTALDSLAALGSVARAGLRGIAGRAAAPRMRQWLLRGEARLAHWRPVGVCLLGLLLALFVLLALPVLARLTAGVLP